MADPHLHLNAMKSSQATLALAKCCGSKRWVQQMCTLRPFASSEALYAAAERVWRGLSADDHIEAFSHHPRIGAKTDELERRFPATAVQSSKEQAGVKVARTDVLEALRVGNAAYEARFGFVFLVFATGKTAEQILGLLHDRLGNERAIELQVAADEHVQITRLRLEKLGA
jgi:2-oxo-4-hydroxy-4-carboxy-5-ureidoimidazoline decarboxylase